MEVWKGQGIGNGRARTGSRELERHLEKSRHDERCLEKKDGTNGRAVRAGRPVTQTTSGLENLLHNRNKYTIA
jgi:hypothetical protein